MSITNHQVAFNLLDDLENDSELVYEYKILIFLNKPKSKNQFKILQQKVDLVIFSNGCSNEIFEEFGDDITPSCIIGDISNLTKETKQICEKHKIQLISKSGDEKTDLEKSLYYCFEKIAKVGCSPILKSKSYNYLSMKSAVIVYFDCENRFDYTMSIYSEVSKYIESEEIDIIILSSNNMSIYLKEGNNIITPSVYFKPEKIGGFSVTSFNQARCKIYEINYEGDEEHILFLGEKIVRFGDSFYSRKFFNPKKLKIEMIALTSFSSALYFTSIQLPE